MGLTEVHIMSHTAMSQRRRGLGRAAVYGQEPNRVEAEGGGIRQAIRASNIGDYIKHLRCAQHGERAMPALTMAVGLTL